MWDNNKCKQLLDNKILSVINIWYNKIEINVFNYINEECRWLD